MSELDPVPPSTGAREWWHSVYGPMDPLAAQLVAVMWQRKEHGESCPFLWGGTPYDCDCWHRARAIVASGLIRDMQHEGRWANPDAVAEGIDLLAGRADPPEGATA